MDSQKKRRMQDPSKTDDRSSGVFPVATAGRLARRGSTRVEPQPSEEAHGRMRLRRNG
jgi:hypothetical protein